MPEFLRDLFTSNGYMPHGHCYLWNPSLVALHVVSDALTALAYTTIPFSLLYLIRKRSDLPFSWMWLCFGAFIVACGGTHMMEIWTLWVPSYWLSGLLKAVTAVASITTAILLVRLVPRALAIPSAAEHARVHEELRRAHDALGRRVEERTIELTKAAEALRLSEERFRRLGDSGIVGLLVAHSNGAILEANDAFLTMVGYTRADLEAGEITSERLNLPEWAAAQEMTRQEYAASGVARAREKEFQRKDGARVPVLAAVTSIEPPHLLSVVVDLTAQKQAEAAAQTLRELREADATIRALLEAAPDAMVIVDHDGNVVLINAQTERLFGYPRGELIGESVDTLLPERFRGVHTTHRNSYFGTPKVRAMGSGSELFAIRKDGTEFPVEVSLSPLETKDGLLVSSAIRDITERKRAEQELRRAKEAAEAAIGELEAFSYSVAHDLRAPLRTINGFSLALTEDFADKLDDVAKDYLARIGAGAGRMGELIDALLALSRVSRTDPKSEPVNLSQIAQSIVGPLAASASERNVVFVVEPDLTASGDPSLLRAVLENLIGNAWKFGSKCEELRIEFGKVGVADGVAAFFVRDTGAGFDIEYAAKLFTPFQRLHAMADFPGTGIGLATVDRIIRRHGGRVWAEGTVNRGATFYFTLQDPRGVLT